MSPHAPVDPFEIPAFLRRAKPASKPELDAGPYTSERAPIVGPFDHGSRCQCFACGASYPEQRGDGRFCSSRCRDAYDAGHVNAYEPYNAVDYLHRFPVSEKIIRQGKHGAIIACAHCRQEFDSKGLRCCSKACERAFSKGDTRQEDLGPLAATPPATRKCEVCEARLPRWINGKAVPSSRRFCSSRCTQRARKLRGSGYVAPTPNRAHEPRFKARKTGTRKTGS